MESSPTPRSPRTRSQLGGRRSMRPPSSHLHSDCPPDPPDDPCDSPSMGKRSVSLTTLQPTIIQPRMAQLETLEAKMASIEVSLSNTPRRRKNGVINGLSLGSCIRAVPKEISTKELEVLRNALRDKENIIQSLKGQLTIPGLRLTNLKNNSNNGSNSNVTNRELTEVEKKHAEERLAKLKTETDNKRLAIKNLKMALERLDITDNIDVRIQQAELEYQLGREELNLLTLLEETRTLQACLDESNKNSNDGNTLYSCVKGSNNVTLIAVEVAYDLQSPKFGASTRETVSGLWIDWALEETGLCKDDRLLEVNGKIVLTKSREDLMRLLSAAPDPAQIVVLRKGSQKDINKGIYSIHHVNGNNAVNEVASLRNELAVVKEQAEEAQKAKDGLRADNVRLTHRISYLEEQVSELLNHKIEPDSQSLITSVKSNRNITNINITSRPPSVSSNDLQVFQKGPQVTALVANIPGLEINKDSHTHLPVRSKSSLSNVSGTHIPAPTLECHRNHRQKHRSSHCSVDNYTHKKHQHQCSREKDYSSETNSNTDHISRQNRRNMENGHHYRNSYSEQNGKDYSSDVSLMDQNYKKATKIVQDLTRYEKHRQKCITASEKYNIDLLKHYNVRKSSSVLDFRSEIQHKSKHLDSKSVEELDFIENHEDTHKSKRLPESRSSKSLDFDSDTNSLAHIASSNGSPKSVDYTSEPLDNNRKPHTYSLNSDYGKPRPTPPKKPLRLSLHKNQAIQSSETMSNGSSSKSELRKPVKRTHKGDAHPVSVTVKVDGSDRNHLENVFNGSGKENGLMPLKWSSFGQFK